MDGKNFLAGLNGPFYDELRLIAGRLMAGERQVTLSATALLHEVLLECADEPKVPTNQSGLRAYCATLMIHKLISAARRHRRRDVPLGDHDRPVEQDVSELLRVDELLESIAKKSEVEFKVVNMRLAQYKSSEISAELGLPVKQVQRSLARVQAFLQQKRPPEGGDAKAAAQ